MADVIFHRQCLGGPNSFDAPAPNHHVLTRCPLMRVCAIECRLRCCRKARVPSVQPRTVQKLTELLIGRELAGDEFREVGAFAIHHPAPHSSYALFPVLHVRHHAARLRTAHHGNTHHLFQDRNDLVAQTLLPAQQEKTEVAAVKDIVCAHRMSYTKHRAGDMTTVMERVLRPRMLAEEIRTHAVHRYEPSSRLPRKRHRAGPAEPAGQQQAPDPPAVANDGGVPAVCSSHTNMLRTRRAPQVVSRQRPACMASDARSHQVKQLVHTCQQPVGPQKRQARAESSGRCSQHGSFATPGPGGLGLDSKSSAK